jgi:hypothetical protein
MRKIFNLFLFAFGLLGSILFWVFLIKGDVYEELYPLIGHFVASHGLLGSMIYVYSKKIKF